MNASKLPVIEKVKECLPSRGYSTIIAPDPKAGLKHRYSVLRIFYGSGETVCIGRELDLKLARAVAAKPPTKE